MLVCDRLKIKKRRYFLIQHVVKLWNSLMQNIVDIKFYMGSREDWATMEKKPTEVSSHYRNHLWFKVHEVQLVVS